MKAKRRPVIVITPPPPPPPGVIQPRGGAQVYRPMALVAPIFSVVDAITGQIRFPESFVDRIRTLEFPEFLYLPRFAGVLGVPGLVRLAEQRAVYAPHLDAFNCRLRAPLWRILEGQLQCLITGQPAGDFHAYREELLHPEPRKAPT